MTDIFNYFVTWFQSYPVNFYTSFIRDLVVLDPIKTTNEYLVDLINDNSLLLDKLNNIIHLQQETLNSFYQLNYLLWWLVLIVFIAFCGWIVKTIVYSVLHALGI